MRLTPAVALQLLTIFQAVFFAGFLLVRRRPTRPANALLAALRVPLATHLNANLLVDHTAPAAGVPGRSALRASVTAALACSTVRCCSPSSRH
jgi:hypothetical protein